MNFGFGNRYQIIVWFLVCYIAYIDNLVFLERSASPSKLLGNLLVKLDVNINGTADHCLSLSESNLADRFFPHFCHKLFIFPIQIPLTS